jgi:hypothetical protein
MFPVVRTRKTALVLRNNNSQNFTNEAVILLHSSDYSFEEFLQLFNLENLISTYKKGIFLNFNKPTQIRHFELIYFRKRNKFKSPNSHKPPKGSQQYRKMLKYFYLFIAKFG